MDERKAGIRCRGKEERKSRMTSGGTTKKGSRKDAREMHRGRAAGRNGEGDREGKNCTLMYVMVTRWSRKWTANELTGDQDRAHGE